MFNPTDQSQREREIRDIVNLPESGVVKKVHQRSKPGENETIRVNVLSNEGDKYERVPWMTPTRGMVSLPKKGDLTLLVFLQGVGKEPRAVGNFHTKQHKPPLSREGDWRVREGNAVFETRKVGGERVINVGFQPTDGGNIKSGIVMKEGETPKLIDENGDNLLVQQSPGGGGGGGGGLGSGFESIPTGGAGGDGTGIGKPKFSINNTVNAVKDLGLDPNKGAAINGAIEGVGNNTEVVFPPGTYRVNTNDNTGISLDGNNVWLHGKKGQKRGEVKFQLPDGKAGRGFTVNGSNVAITNATFDHSNHKASVIGVHIGGDANGCYFYNVQHIGKNLPSKSLGNPLGRIAREEVNGKVHCWAFGHDNGVCRIENYKWTDPETQVKEYPNGLIGMQAPRGMKGTIELVNNHMAWRSEHNVYASRCSGGVHVKGGYYHNSYNTNMRIEGSNSWMEDATIHVDVNPSRGKNASKAIRGMRWENNKPTASNGGYIKNCDFIITSSIPYGNSSLITAEYKTSGLSITNCRFYDDDSSSPTCNIQVPGVVFDGCSFTGNSSNDVVNGNGDTVVKNTCSSMSGGFPGCDTSNMSSSNCELPAKAK